MPIDLDVQQWHLIEEIPDSRDIKELINDVLALVADDKNYSCTIRLVEAQESAELNERYRNKTGPTNVLSFPFEEIPGVETDLLGDLLICAPVVLSEAKEQNKPVKMHFSHMVVHGILHLLGFDHQTPEQAEIMENLEIAVLKQHGYPDPYSIPEGTN